LCFPAILTQGRKTEELILVFLNLNIKVEAWKDFERLKRLGTLMVYYGSQQEQKDSPSPNGEVGFSLCEKKRKQFPD
jgi:hypothetical protein